MTRTYKLNHAPGSGRLVGHAVKLERRAAAVEQIKALLEEGPKTAADVRESLGLNGSTVFAYLHYMASELRIARKSGVQDQKGRVLWELGEDLTLPNPDAQRTSTVPARQVGMWRDHLVAALFGSAAVQRAPA